MSRTVTNAYTFSNVCFPPSSARFATENLILLRLPHLGRTIIASRSYHLSIGRPQRLPDCVPGAMTAVGVDMSCCRGRPDLRCTVVTAGNNLCIIRRPRYRPDTLRVTGVRE